MSASTPGGTGPASPGQPAAAGADPSMEDILASIRRILSEDEAPGAAPAHAIAAPLPDDAEVFTLQESMIVAEPPSQPEPQPAPHLAQSVPAQSVPAQSVPAQPAPAQPAPIQTQARAELPPSPASAPNPEPEPAPRPASPNHLVAPEAEAAAAGSVSALLRTLVAGREQVHVYRSGPTIEDMVREEVRPLLKAWLDTNLPPIVERLVRAEIERVVGRALP